MAEALTPENATAKARRVLVVDDDEDFADSIAELLEMRGYSVAVENDDRLARAAAEGFAPEIALIEIRLGRASGVDLVSALKDRQPELICVMVTAYAELDAAVKALRAGADDFLTKPLDPAILFATLERGFAKRKLLCEKLAAEAALRQAHESLEHKVVERTGALRESEQRFHDFSDASSDWFWEMDENLRFSYFSDSYRDITGALQDTLLGKTREETGMPNLDPEVWEAHLADLAAHRSFRDFQITRTRVDGSPASLSINGKAIFDEAGHFLGYRGTGRDISARERAEEALKAAHDELERRVEERTRELLVTNTQLVQEIADRNRAEVELRMSEARYREIFDESPVGVWQSDWSAVKRLIDDLAKRGVTDWPGYFAQDPERLSEAYDLIKLVRVSRAVLELYGVADTASLAKIYRAATVPKDNLDGFREALLSFIGGSMTSLYEARERRADGAEIITRNTLAVPVNYADDWSRVLYSVEDITERKRIEERFRRYFELPLVGSAIYAPDKKWIAVNDALCDLLGYSREELMEITWPEITHPDDLEENLRLFEAALSRTGANAYSMDKRFIRKDGSVIHAMICGECVHKLDGAPDYFILLVQDITDRKRAEDGLRESEARYRTLTTVAPVGIFHSDAQGLVTYVNEKWCEIGGMTAEQAMGTGWLAAVHPEDRESIATKWDAFVRTQSPFRTEYRYQRQDGVGAYCFVEALPETDRAGKLIGYVGSVTDITERKRAEEALRESEQSLANAQRIAHMGSWDWNIVTNGMLWSDGTYRIYGLEPPEFGATHDLFMDAVHPDDRMRVNDAVDKTIASHELYSIEFRLLRPDGVVRFVHERGEVIYGDDGAPLRMNGTVHDITERKQAEEALHESEARYREIFDESPVGVWEDDWSDVKRMLDDLVAGGVTDLREYFNDNPNKFNEAFNLSKIVEISRATIELYGAPNKQALIELDRAELKSDEELDGFMGSMIAFMAGETEFEFESPDRRLDGTPMVTTSRLVIPPQHRHDWSRVIFAIEDITERKRAEEALRTLNEELEQRVEERTAALLAAQDELVRKERLATLGQLTATVSHELRNPLGAMRTSIAVIRKLTRVESPLLRESVEITDRSITRCDGIISDLLDYTRVQPLDLQATEIDDWVAGILDEYALPDDVAMHRNLRSGAEIRLDRDRLRRTLINLLDNACQAMGEGWEGESSITVGADISGERLRVSVRDTGPGIAPDQIDKVFEPLFSTKSFGVGLGLSIVKQIAEQHGGGVDIDSEPGRGTTFLLWLPLTGEEERAA